MPEFAYKAKDSSGKTVEGTVDAPDSRAAAGKIREMGCWPLLVREHGSKTRATGRTVERVFGPVWTGVSIRALAIFFRQLATMLEAGMTLSQAFANLSRQRGMGRLPAIAASAAEHVRSGGKASDVMAAHPHVFGSMQIGLVRAGETGGMLDAMIGRIAAYLERELEFRSKLARVTFYPKLLFLGILLIPRAPGLILGGNPTLIALAHDLVQLTLWIIGIYILIKLLLAIPSVRLVWDTLKLSVPVLGTVSRKLAMARFSTALSVMFTAGMPMSQAVELASDAAGNESLRRALLTAVPETRRGGQLSPALKRVGGVPHLVLGMVETGERTGSLDNTLDKVSEYYSSESATTLEKFSYLLFVVLILAAGVMVGLSVLAGYQQYTSHLGV